MLFRDNRIRPYLSRLYGVRPWPAVIAPPQHLSGEPSQMQDWSETWFRAIPWSLHQEAIYDDSELYGILCSLQVPRKTMVLSCPKLRYGRGMKCPRWFSRIKLTLQAEKYVIRWNQLFRLHDTLHNQLLVSLNQVGIPGHLEKISPLVKVADGTQQSMIDPILDYLENVGIHMTPLGSCSTKFAWDILTLAIRDICDNKANADIWKKL